VATYFALRGLVWFAGAAALMAQAPARQPNAGLEADWDIAAVIKEIGSHAARLGPTLDRINVQNWIERGASETYAAQLQSAKEQTNAVARGAAVLANNPEQLSAALELFFRVEGIESMLGSLEEGMRRYQKPSDAQMLVALEAENGANRNRLQRYIVNLAVQREQEFQVMDREAQRCRGTLTQLPGRKK
jgi:hypothetical protein